MIITLVQNFKNFEKGRGTLRRLTAGHCPESINQEILRGPKARSLNLDFTISKSDEFIMLLYGRSL